MQSPREQLLHELFQEQVERTPEAIAVEGISLTAPERTKLTYRELDRWANDLASRLRRLKIQDGDIVALVTERSLEMVVGLIGILKAGATYLPIDPAYPSERKQSILEDAKPTAVVVAKHGNHRDEVGIHLGKALEPTTLFDTRISPGTPAYLIYTSGSTGKPKGVLVSHRALVNHTSAVSEVYAINPNDRLLQFASISFDVAAEEIFPALLRGAAVVLRSEECIGSFPAFEAFLQEKKISILNLPASFWHEWVNEFERVPRPWPDYVRLLVVGNERVRAGHYLAWKRIAPKGLRWLNAYGPTEATITATIFDPEQSSWDPANDPAGNAVPIGKPITNVQAYLLDDNGAPVAPGKPGELCLAGPGLAEGYLHKPELTAKRFVVFEPRPGLSIRIYKTGDLARLLPDGNLEFLGRKDEQVKVRGFRIEPAEVEAALLRTPGIKQTAVVGQEDGRGQTRLVAYFVPSADHPQNGHQLAIESLRRDLQRLLPDYMVPAAFVRLPNLPTLPNGKLDRRSLPPADFEHHSGSITAPRSPVEETLCGIWKDVLRVHTLGIDSAFLDLGGDSLHATQIVSRIREQLGAELSLKEFLQAGDIASLARVLQQRDKPLTTMAPLTAREHDRPMPLSFAQQRLWFLDQLEPGGYAYNMPEALEILGPLDNAALEGSLSQIIHRHKVLRTIYVDDGGKPAQIVRPAPRLTLPLIDLSEVAAEHREQRVRELVQEEAKKPFDLSKDVMFRATLYHLGEERHILLLIMHHIAADAWSMGIFYEELLELYQARRENREPHLPKLAVQYVDYAQWQREFLSGEVSARELSYWKSSLEGAPQALELPLDFPRPPAQTNNGASISFALPASAAELERFSRGRGVTVFVTLLSAFKALLHRWTGEKDIVIGSPVFGRTRTETERLIGFFVNTLALRTKLDGATSYADLLARVQESALGALAHQELPFEKLVEELQPERDPAYSPFFQVMFALQNAPMPPLETAGLRVRPFEFDSGAALFDVTLQITREANHFTGVLTYNTDLLREETGRQLVAHYQRVVSACLARPDASLAELEFIGPDEVQKQEELFQKYGVRVLDDQRRPRPLNCIGELCYADKSVPELKSAECLGRLRHDGSLEVLGPSPKQFSIRGRRVNIATVEAALREDPNVHDCAVFLRRHQDGRDRLVGYIVPAGAFVPAQILLRLRAKVPQSWRPRYLIPVARIPVNVSGLEDLPLLESVPFIDEPVIADWEKKARQLYPGKELAVVVRDAEISRGHIHLTDLLPWLKRQAPVAPPAAANHNKTSAPRAPSVTHSPAINLGSHARSTLQILLCAAAQQATGSILYHTTDGAKEQAYHQLLAEASSILAGLHSAGAKPQDKIILQLDAASDFFPAFWACVLGGFVPVPIGVPTTFEKGNAVVQKIAHAAHLLERPRLITNKQSADGLQNCLGDGATLLRIEDLRKHAPHPQVHKSDPGDVALLMLTSGSTGAPKLVTLTHQNLISRCVGSQVLNGWRPDEVTLNWMPLDHVAGLIYFHLRDVFLRCRQIHVPPSYVLENPTRWLDLLHQYQATITFAPNFAYGLILDAAKQWSAPKWDLSSVRAVLNGAEPIVARTARSFLKLLQPYGLPQDSMRPAWGMAETSSGVTYSRHFTIENTSDQDSFVEVGDPIPGVDFRIVDESGQVLPEDAIGQVQVKGATVTRGYYKNDEANKAAFTSDGWFNTGDLGYLKAGRLTVTGRHKDVIIINATNFYSHEIEAAVEEVPGIQASFTAAIGGRRGGVQTDELVLFFSPKDHHGLRELANEIRGCITRKFGVAPGCIIPLAPHEIPKTALGKIQRSLLKSRFENGEFQELTRKMDVLSENSNTVPEWFFVPASERRELTDVPKGVVLERLAPAEGQALRKQLLAKSGDTALIFQSNELPGGILQNVFGQDLIRVTPGQAFGEHAKGEFTIDSSSPEQFQRLFAVLFERKLHPAVVLYDESFLKNPDEFSLLSNILWVARALIRYTEESAKARFYVLAHRGETVARAALAPVLKCLSQEVPRLQTRLISFGEGVQTSQPATALAELLSSNTDCDVAYRGGARFVPVLSAATLKTDSLTTPLVQGGNYVITGGLGGIGKVLSEHLLEEAQANVLLLGRTSLPATVTDNQTSERGASLRRDLEALEKLPGSVLYRQVDVTDPQKLEEAIAEFERLKGRPVNGVFHLAGVDSPQPFAEETSRRLLDTIQPKVAGARALHEIVAKRPEAFCVSFSSVNSFFGGPNYTAYAAANCALEQVVAEANARLPGRFFCYSWSMWDDLGMNKSFTQKEVSQLRGFEAIPARRGLHSLFGLLARRIPAAFVGLDSRNPFIRRNLAHGPLQLQELAGFCADESVDLARSGVMEVKDIFGTGTPCAWRHLPSPPRTASGELDREKLARGRISSGGGKHLPPRNDLEQHLAKIWREILNLETLGVEDNFFELGGHSLLATQLISRLRQTFGVDLPLQKLFEAPTIATLAEAIQSALGKKSNMQPAPIKPIARQGEFPLSFAQERLWFLEQLTPNTAAYNILTALRLRGSLNLTALHHTFNEIIRRHESFRTSFRVVNESPMQVIASKGQVALQTLDLTGLDAAAQELETPRIAVQEGRQPFDLAKGPLFRVKLIKLNPEEHVLLLVMHHIVFDGWSQGIFLREFGELYECFCNRKAPALNELEIQYADYAQWQREALDASALHEDIGWWKEQLAGELPVLQLPSDRPSPPNPTFEGGLINLVLPPRLLQELRAFSQRENATLFMTLLAAFKTLLCRYTGQEDIIVGSPVANRTHVELEKVIGFFTNTLVLRTDLSGNPTGRELLQRVKKTALSAYSHQHVPFEKLVEAINPKRDLSHQPLFQVMFVLQNTPQESARLSGLTVTPVDVDFEVSMFDLTLHASETEEGLKIALEYNTDVFDPETIEGFGKHYHNLLRAMVCTPDLPIERMPLLSEEERHEVLVEWNQTEQVFPSTATLHGLIEQQAARTPSAVALNFEGKNLSYAELNALANKWAALLLREGAGPNKLIGICMERSLELVIGLLAILKSGAAYVPLDPSYPSDRLAFMVNDAAPPVVLTQTKWTSLLEQASPTGKRICLDAATDLSAFPDTNPSRNVSPDDLAYMIYTSGSTGQPKGALNTHRAICNRLLWMVDRYPVTANDVVMQKTPFSFDVSVWEFFWPLITGLKLVIARPGGHQDPAYLLGLIKSEKITMIHFVPSMLEVFLEQPGIEDCVSLRHVICSGEALNWELQTRFFKRLRCSLVNLYGPTETAVEVTHWACREDYPRKVVPIGRPLANTQAYVLDKHMQPVPVGVPGELHIGGVQVGLGYYKRPDLTAAKFIPNPFVPGGRLYKTGDRARFLPDGNIEFLGRLDHQVKLRGFRIELTEIDSQLSQHPNIRRALTILRDTPVKCLTAYVVPRQEPAPKPEELKEFLSRKLPDYMIPAFFVPMTEIPLSPSGKANIRALPEPGIVRTGTDTPERDSDMLEVQLRHIWQNVLSVPAVGVQDNFFALGGHSLLAVRLFNQIARITGRDLPLATLFQAPTIEQLAAVLRHDGWTPPWSSLVPIKPSGGQRPFFIIHGVGGNVLNFHDLAKHMGPDQPVYGLQSRGLDGREAPPTRVEDMAAHYIKEIRSLQPEGPYYLGGMSFGGVVAYEAAQQLLAAGQKVGVLALLDTFPLGSSELTPIVHRARREVDFLGKRVKGHLSAFNKVPKGQRLMYIFKKLRTIHRRTRSRIWQATYKLYAKRVGAESVPAVLLNVKEANFMASRDYVTRPYHGKVTLFLASEQSISDVDPKALWSTLALGGLDVYEIPGDHVTLIEEPHVQVLAQKLREVMGQDSTPPQDRSTLQANRQV